MRNKKEEWPLAIDRIGRHNVPQLLKLINDMKLINEKYDADESLT